jgi:hypothetical protein
LVQSKTKGKSNVDNEKFKVFGKACKDFLKDFEDSKNVNLDFNAEDQTVVGEDEIHCDIHPSAKGKFYCDDCKLFICKVCFANEHRSCNSNLLNDTSNNFKKNLKNFGEMMGKFLPKIDESTKTITELELKIKDINDISTKKLDNLINNINKSSIKKNDGFMEEYKQAFEGIDDDVSDVHHRLSNLQGGLSALIGEIIEIRTNFMKKENGFEACEYKQMNARAFIEAQKIFKDTKYLIGSKVDNSIKAATQKLNIFEEEAKNIFKKIKVHRSSVINSIQTGISSFTLRIRRFTKFSKTGINFFKTSSLKFSSNSPISIVGFSVCGLFSEEYMKNILSSKEENEKKSALTMNNTALESLTKIVMKGNEKTLPFKFTIKEISSEAKPLGQELISENFILKEIKNPIDPTLIYYLNKSINISPEKTYIVSIVNLSKDVYLDLWSGEVSKYFLNTMSQGLRCNSSGIKFEFNPPEGIESDFNEFNSGILSDFIFSHKE